MDLSLFNPLPNHNRSIFVPLPDPMDLYVDPHPAGKCPKMPQMPELSPSKVKRQRYPFTIFLYIYDTDYPPCSSGRLVPWIPEPEY